MARTVILLRCVTFFLSAFVERKYFILAWMTWMTNIMLVYSNIQAEKARLNSICFASRFSNCKPTQLWNNIRSLVEIRLKFGCNISDMNVDEPNESFIYGPTDTPFTFIQLTVTRTREHPNLKVILVGYVTAICYAQCIDIH